MSAADRDITAIKWNKLSTRLPPTRDKYYIFGGYDTEGAFVFNKYHYATNGTINGWSVACAIRNGVIWWCDLKGPTIDH